jgi:hypothetical protein
MTKAMKIAMIGAAMIGLGATGALAGEGGCNWGAKATTAQTPVTLPITTAQAPTPTAPTVR